MERVEWLLSHWKRGIMTDLALTSLFLATQTSFQTSRNLQPPASENITGMCEMSHLCKQWGGFADAEVLSPLLGRNLFPEGLTHSRVCFSSLESVRLMCCAKCCYVMCVGDVLNAVWLIALITLPLSHKLRMYNLKGKRTLVVYIVEGGRVCRF